MGETPANTSAIATGLTDPAVVTTDGQTVQTRPMADLVLGIQFQAAAVAATLKHRGLRFTKLTLPAQCPGPRGPYPVGWGF